MAKIISIFLCVFTIASAFAQQSIQYIANEGILIQTENKNILIDAIFDDYYKTFLAPSEQIISRMNAKESPFQKIDLLLITHAHLDHFNAQMVNEFLKSHKESEIICTKQSVDSLVLDTKSFEKVKSRVNGIVTSKEWQSLLINEIEIQTTYIRHGGKQNYTVDNHIYLIDINGKNILHLGDAEMDLSHFSQLNLPQAPIEVALVPYWYLLYPPGIDIIKTEIRPKSIVAIHYPKVGDPKSLEKIRVNFPEAVVFIQEGDKIDF